MERVTGKGVDAGNAGQLRAVQRPGAHGDEPGTDAIAAIGVDDPARGFVVPLQLADLCGEQRVVVETEGGGDALRVAEDLWCEHVLLAGHVPRLLQQRQVHHRCGVAHRSGVAVPVPGASEVASTFDEAHVGDARLLEPGAGDQAGEPTADEGHGDLVEQRLALDARHVRVVEEVREATGGLQVLLVAIGSHALVALLAILRSQRRLLGRLGCAHGPDGT